MQEPLFYMSVVNSPDIGKSIMAPKNGAGI